MHQDTWVENTDSVMKQFIVCTLYSELSRCSSVSIVSDYGLDDRAIGFRSPAEAKYFSSIFCVQTGSGAHPASCTMGTGGPFSGGKARSGRDADYPPHLEPKSRMSRSYTSPPPSPSASMADSGTAVRYFFVEDELVGNVACVQEI
jgi:hypothetical protein